MPLAADGTASARIEFASGGILIVSAEGFSCAATGEPDPNFKERYEA
ncbi:hypothetical protein [Acidovorax lacteus]